MYGLRTSFALVSLCLLASCGDTLGEQAGYGAAAGAVTSFALEQDMLTGAALGAAANIAYCSSYPARC
jgi:hypothetical protein